MMKQMVLSKLSQNTPRLVAGMDVPLGRSDVSFPGSPNQLI
jgi:hypothetical protein